MDDPLVVLDFFAEQLIPQERDDRKRAEIHEQINGKVIDQSFDGSRCRVWLNTASRRMEDEHRRDRHEHVTRVSDRRIGEQSLEIRLRISRQIPERRRHGSQHAQPQTEHQSQVRQTTFRATGDSQREPDQQREGRGLRTDRQETGDFR